MRSEHISKKTRHKCCWFCGNRLQGGKGVRHKVSDNFVDAHKSCVQDGTIDLNFPYGMEH